MPVPRQGACQGASEPPADAGPGFGRFGLRLSGVCSDACLDVCSDA